MAIRQAGRASWGLRPLPVSLGLLKVCKLATQLPGPFAIWQLDATTCCAQHTCKLFIYIFTQKTADT